MTNRYSFLQHQESDEETTAGEAPVDIHKSLLLASLLKEIGRTLFTGHKDKISDI